MPPIFSRRARVVVAADFEVTVQQVEHRQVRRRLAMRDREGLQHHPAGLILDLELVEQARFAGACLRHRGDDLPAPGPRLLGRALERVHLGIPPHELRQSAAGRALQPRPQRPESCHLINADRLAQAFDPGRTQRLELEVSFHQFAGPLADRDRAGRCERLHPRCEIGGVADRCVLGMSFAGGDRSNDHLARVHADACFERQVSSLAQSRRVAFQFFLHTERCVQRSLRMVLVRDRRAEQCEDAIAGALHDVAVIAPHRVDHQLERRIDNRARLFGIEVLLQLGRSLDIRKQRRDRLALAFEIFRGG